jgi:RNA polymerase sigma-70 factor (ECF subfamily)
LPTPLATTLVDEPVAAAAATGAESRDFEAIFREFAPYVVRVLPRMGVAASDLDDVMQDVFVAIHRALPQFEARSSLKSWVYGICIRTCSNYRQRAHRRRERLSGSVPEVAITTDPEQSLMARRALERLDVALAQLPQPQRAAFVLYEIEELSIQEIAAALDCSKFTIYARLYAARRAVSAALRDAKGEGHDHG